MSYAPNDASDATARANRDAVSLYGMDDRQDFDDARRGLVAPIPGGKTLADDGSVVFDLDAYGYLSDDASCPDTVNPSF